MKLKKAETKLKRKAVKQYQDFKEATSILREHRMNAKQGRHLLKRHYVALFEDVGGVQHPEKEKKAALKTLFWSQPDIFRKYMDHGPPSSESSDDDGEDGNDGNDGDNGADGNDGDDGDNDNDNDDSDEWQPSNEEDDEPSEAWSDQYYRYAVDDEVDAYWGGDKTTAAGWEFAVIAGIIDDGEYSVIFEFNGEQVRKGVSHPDTHTP